jgi:hypothetical protein
LAPPFGTNTQQQNLPSGSNLLGVGFHSQEGPVSVATVIPAGRRPAAI